MLRLFELYPFALACSGRPCRQTSCSFSCPLSVTWVHILSGHSADRPHRAGLRVLLSRFVFIHQLLASLDCLYVQLASTSSDSVETVTNNGDFAFHRLTPELMAECERVISKTLPACVAFHKPSFLQQLKNGALDPSMIHALLTTASRYVV